MFVIKGLHKVETVLEIVKSGIKYKTLKEVYCESGNTFFKGMYKSTDTITHRYRVGDKNNRLKMIQLKKFSCLNLLTK